MDHGILCVEEDNEKQEPYKSLEAQNMNNELLAILEYIEQERGISKAQLAGAIEKALLTASRKSIHPASDLTVKMDPATGEIKAWAKLKVVEEFPNNDEIRLSDARKRIPDAKIGDIVNWEVTPKNFGRIAAQTARQAILQQIREAEKEIVQEEFKDKVGQLISGTVRRIEAGNIFVDFGKSEGIISGKDRVLGEQYTIGERVTALLLKIDEKSEPSLILSRSNPGFVRRLFEREVTEIHDGVVEIVGIARDPGSRSKIAVRSNDPRIDPVGACVGMRGMRVRNITGELGGERVDIIAFSENLEKFLANALHPAKLLSIEPDFEKKQVTVHVDEDNSRLAFGKKAQNIKLAQRLLQWQITIVIDKDQDAEEFAEKKAQAVSELAVQLGIEEPAAEILVNNGYLSVDELKNIPMEELQKIEGLDESVLSSIREKLA